ncbi:MAG: transcriptional repressor [Flavobacteriales bacterium]|nr:transcriptional repressor [Flavobacteriales bacterium]
MDSVQLKELLRKRNLKATHTRLSLLNKMHAYGSAMSHSVIQKQMQPIDRVTLYRTIESLHEKGIIHKAFQENNETFYAICGSSCNTQAHKHDHAHFKCLKCNTVSCQELDETLKISLPNYEINKVSIHIEGICDLCH